jgi:hypothetical protein
MSVCFDYFGSCMLPFEHIILIASQTINTAVCSAKKPQQIPILVFSLTRLGLGVKRYSAQTDKRYHEKRVCIVLSVFVVAKSVLFSQTASVQILRKKIFISHRTVGSLTSLKW